MPSRRTRFVCISDTHNCTVRLPKGDVLIHAGDLTNQGSYSELAKAVEWLEKAEFEAKIVIAGNHDVTLDGPFFAHHGSSFRYKAPQDPEESISLLTSSPTITYLRHSQATIHLTRPDGPGTVFTIFGSPYSPRHGLWAFGYDRPDPSTTQLSTKSHSAADSHPEPVSPAPLAAVTGELQAPAPTAAELWSCIPPAVDILVTHTPPRLHCDASPSRGGPLGCEDLRRALALVRPRLHVCGHVHEARGVERIRWQVGDGGGQNATCAEPQVERWEDPNPGPENKKISLVDLTGRRQKTRPDGQRAHPVEDGHRGTQPPQGEPREKVLGDARANSYLSERCAAFKHGGPAHTGSNSPEGPGLYNSENHLQHEGGQPGFVPASPGRTSDLSTMGSPETCVVNCAILASRWPHVGGKRMNKPVVVDLDLPVWDGGIAATPRCPNVAG